MPAPTPPAPTPPAPAPAEAALCTPGAGTGTHALGLSHVAANALIVLVAMPAPFSIALAVWNGFLSPETAGALAATFAIGYAIGRWRQAASAPLPAVAAAPGAGS